MKNERLVLREVLVPLVVAGALVLGILAGHDYGVRVSKSAYDVWLEESGAGCPNYPELCDAERDMMIAQQFRWSEIVLWGAVVVGVLYAVLVGVAWLVRGGVRREGEGGV